MGSFSSNMHNHITLQAQGSSIYLTVKKSYTNIQREDIKAAKINQKRHQAKIHKAYQVHSHIYHSEELHWGQQVLLVHAGWQACYTCGPVSLQFEK